jgi:hyperosmotically inducible protein
MRQVVIAIMLGLAVAVSACGQSDAGITTAVKSRLIQDDLVRARVIDVDTQNAVVTLTGEVESTSEEARALEIARTTDNVVDVVDNISIAAAESAAVPTTGTFDPALTVEVKTKLMADPAVSGLSIDVDTSDGVVTLTGNVATQAEKDRAIEIARGVGNVLRVEDKIVVGKAEPR